VAVLALSRALAREEGRASEDGVHIVPSQVRSQPLEAQPA
jgi:hypothetical protein